jgi:hypothetical protein
MARYSGKPLGLKHAVETMLTDETFTALEACRKRRAENRAVFIRQAIIHFILTQCSSNPISATMQPTDEGQTP